MLAAKESKRRGLPRGSLFLAPETVRNLQQGALGLLTVFVTKSREGNPWKRGDHRLGELPIERHFGRLRSQSASAQLNAKSFWRASARDMMRSIKVNKQPASPPADDLPPLSNDDFFQLTERAYRASIRFAAFCQGCTNDSLHEMYEEYCQREEYLQDGPLLGDEEEFLEVLEEEDPSFENQDANEAHQEETKRFLNQIQAEAGMKDDLPLDSSQPEDLDDLGEVPDGDLLNELFNVQDGKGPDEPPPSPTKGTCSVPSMACNLHHALWTLGPSATEEEVFDSIFRLVMYLRHWQGGSDRTWNEHKLKELRDAEDTTAYRQRASRLAKWIEMTQERARENAVVIPPVDALESGHVVMVLLPGTDGGRHVHVGLTLSCWVSMKKPKLATAPASLGHLVCARIVVMDPVDDKDTCTTFSCTGHSHAWVVKPESIVAILAPSTISDEVNMCKVTLSDDSLALLRTESVKDWRPEPDNSPDEPHRGKKHAGLFLRGQRRKARTRKPRAKAKSKAAAKPSKTKKVNKVKKVHKKTSKKSKLKKSKPMEPVENVESNYKRTGVGPILVMQQMEKAKHADKIKFPGNLLFTEKDDTCRMTVGTCGGRPWADFVNSAPGYFRCVYKDSSGKQFSKSVAKTFMQVFEELEASPPNRKKWLKLLKEISDYVACLAKAPPAGGEC
eukprot:s1370_g22.t1